MNMQEFNIITDCALAAQTLPLEVSAGRRVLTLAAPLLSLSEDRRVGLDTLRGEPESVRVRLAKLPGPMWIEVGGIKMRVLRALPN